MASPLPAIAPFLGIREKDLPYAGKPNSHSTQGFSSNPFPLKGHGDDDASHLFSILTGIPFVDDCVTNASVKKTGRKRAHPTHVRGMGFAERSTVGCSTYEEGAQHKVEQSLAPGLVQEGPPCFEKALDTTDLSFWMYTVVPDVKSNPEEELYSDADSEELERRAANEKVPERVVSNDHEQVDDHTKREEFRARVKESLSFVRMRTEMLQDLSLGEASKEESAGGGDTSFLSSTSVLLKHARRQAGILHTEEQALRLQDLYQWFQNIGLQLLVPCVMDTGCVCISNKFGPLYGFRGKTLGDDALGASSKSSLHNQLDRLRSLNVVKDLCEADQESKPSPTSSPFELLRQVEHDVRDRLANLYQGKNFILSHQADIWANGKSESPASGNNEEMLHATMEKLQKMENAYEMLGTTILESLKEVERMEEDFHMLQSELVTNGCPLLAISRKKKKSKKSSHKGKKKGASSESDSMNTGSSRSESSSAQSSSRPTNAQVEDLSSGKDVSIVPEQPSNSKGQNNSKGPVKKNIETGGKAESKSSLKTKKKSPSQKNEKKKGGKLEGKDDVANQENNKRPSPISAEASTPPQASSLSAWSPVAEATPLNVAPKEERGQDFTSASPGNNNNASREGAVSGAPAVIEDVHVQEGAKPPSSDTKGQVVNERPGSAEPPRYSKGAGDLLGVQNTLILPKTSLDGRDVKPSDSASLQILPKPKRKSRRISSEVSKDEIVQTDDVAILSLEKKMQKQLQFWRTKNWAEKHTGQGHMMPPPVYNQFIKVDASPDMGMLCYYNPRTGAHVTKNMSDLDTIMQQSFMNLVAGPSRAL